MVKSFNPAYMNAWLNLFLDYNFKGQLITDANIRERVEYWKQTGK